MALDIITWSQLKKKADLVGGKVPAEQLPSYVDDVLEYSSVSAFPQEGEQGKIYVALDTNKTYRWSGSQYIPIGGEDGLFYCTYGTTTFAQITQALNDGKLPVCFYDNKQYVYVGLSLTNRYTFSSQLFDANRYISVNNSDSWGNGSNNFETISNKVTSISSSSTDSQYPSAKCIYDNLAYLTTAPTSDNTSGILKFVVLSEEPATKYDGYLYLITE